MNKKVCIVIVVIILLGIICGIMLNKNSKNTNDQNEEKRLEENSVVNQQVANEEANVVDNETVNEVQETLTNSEKENTTTETFTEEPKTAEEKAIAIAKKDYGNEQGVKFGVEGIDESGRYIVTVRNSDTTEALAFYFVNLTNSTFTKKEMN